MSLNTALIAEMITQDSTALTQLKQLLERERSQLEQRQSDQLATIIEQKAILLDQLNLNSKRRQEVLEANQMDTNAAGWDCFLALNNAPESVRSSWQQVTQQFGDCQAMNEINGKMIARSQQTLNQLLNLLRGKVAAPSLYTAQGGKAHTSSSYTVAKA